MNPPLIENIIRTDTKGGNEIFTQPAIYTFLNPVSYLDALKNKNLFAQFDGIFVDGSLLCNAVKLLYKKSLTRRSFDMTSLAPQLFEYAQEYNKTVYFVASEQTQIEKAVVNLTQQYPQLQIAGYRNGYFSSEEEKPSAIQTICSVKPDFLIVGMGIIKQEQFLLSAKQNGFSGIGFTCGGFIHQTAVNEVQYYPQWIDKMNLRFVYRFIKEKHTRKRYIKAFYVFPVKFSLEWIQSFFIEE